VARRHTSQLAGGATNKDEGGNMKSRILRYIAVMKLRLVPSLVLAFLFAASSVAAATTWYVNGVTGSDSNNCLSPTTACKTIGHAISLSLSGDSIRVAAATYKENLSIGFNLDILGSNATTTIIDGGGGPTVVSISSASAHVALSRLTIRNGGGRYGGGISNQGTLRVIDSTVSGNVALSSFVARGGGINNTGTVTISNSTLSGNTARLECSRSCVAEGGGIFNSGTLTINNSTLSGNSAVRSGGNGFGGGIFNLGGTVTINNSTLSGNSADTSGGGIFNNGAAALQNSIVANSPSGGNCGTGPNTVTMTSKGYNLSSDGSCDFDGPGDLNNTDPMLGPLQNNGGPTQTMALPSGSPAVDTGNPSGCTDGLGHLLKTDQRGKPRPDTEDTGGCDIGAFEKQSD
jgi:hypothetical protein